MVYDLDGTLLDLVVDWGAVADDVADLLVENGVDAQGVDLWEMLDLADDAGVRDDVEAIVADHEREGARRSESLPYAEDLANHAVPIGVCSLNCERACRLALERHGLSDHVDAVVGRDSTVTRKPDPEPLLATVRALSVTPDRDVVFVGDSERDEIAARRAGISFEYVDYARRRA